VKKAFEYIHRRGAENAEEAQRIHYRFSSSGLICEVSTESGSDRVIVLAISIIAIGFYPVATALGTDSM